MTLMALGETAQFINGVAFKPSDWEDQGLPIIRIQNLTGTGEKFNYTTRSVKPELVVEPGDLLVSWSATLNAYRWEGPRGVLNQHIFKVLPNADIDPDYLFYALKSALAELSAKTHGSTMKHVVRADFESTRVNVPPISEQRRIVDILSRAEGIVRLRREAEQKAAELIPALFIDIFGDPSTNPKGWTKTSLGNLCSRITDGTHQPPKFLESGIPFIFVANIVHGELTLNTSKFISEETYTELTKRCPIERDDVLYSTVGSYGVPVKVDTNERFTFQRHIAHLKPDRDKLDSDFLVGMLSTPALKAQADMAARGIAQKTVNLGEIRKFQVIAPPIDEQKRFAFHVESTRSILAQQLSATVKAQTTFNALLASFFTRN